jgi:hypothetical protein
MNHWYAIVVIGALGARSLIGCELERAVEEKVKLDE